MVRSEVYKPIKGLKLLPRKFLLKIENHPSEVYKPIKGLKLKLFNEFINEVFILV